MNRACALITAGLFAFSACAPLPAAYANSPVTVLDLPVPGTLVNVTPAYHPPIIQGITIHPEDPLLFDFIVSPGQDNVQGAALQDESTKLIKYFLAALTVPENEMWVNLSPYEKNRIVPEGFGQTEMGRDMLAQDYLLKQLTASMMYPEDELGHEFWDRVHKRAYGEYGTTEIPLNTFNKIWIVPEDAAVYINGQTVYVVKSHLKVMLEEDYLALEQHAAESPGDDPISGITANIVKEILIPEIEFEINHGKTFANLRQIFHSVILATWFKNNLQDGILNNVYVDKGKVKGVDHQDREINQKIYDQYVKAFKKGVYNYIKEDYDPQTKAYIPRKYFSGGVTARIPRINVEEDGAVLVQEDNVPAPLNIRVALRRFAEARGITRNEASGEQLTGGGYGDVAMLSKEEFEERLG
ncbi:MAG: hypothetical protein K8I00_06050, partial [Candidatus Omnitrophica bacterium]|nr:hypothetical protein [Candidatus Omnitrophota bacterium]